MSEDIKKLVDDMGQKARSAVKSLATASTDQKNTALKAAAAALLASKDALIEANAKDIEAASQAGRPDAFIDRLRLTSARIEDIATAILDISHLEDPVGRILATYDRPNGLKIERVAVPIGVIAMIYEARPNVGADAGALCLKSGNAVILRGGRESLESSKIIIEAMRSGLVAAKLPRDAIQLVESQDRKAVNALLHASDVIDLAIPRGGKSLVQLVKDEARVPTLLHLEGNCHTYIHKSADIETALKVVKNAKMRRTGVCGATESLVIDEAILDEILPPLVEALEGCEIRADNVARSYISGLTPAKEEDWGREYLDTIISLKTVQSLTEALTHIQRYSSGHTDAIIAEDLTAVDRFQKEIDSAIIMHNASTQFADGGEFGMGAEIGIATGKMHARGPVGLEQLTSFKYLVHGQGQTRP